MTNALPADRSVGVFSDEPPWLVDPTRMPWRAGIDELRERQRAAVPALVRRRRLPPGWRVAAVTGQLSRALIPWALGDRRAGGSASRAGLSRGLRKAAERLGPTYIKLGQIISAGKGIFPDELVSEFELCRDQVPAVSFDAVRTTVERELGGRLEELFNSFDPVPLAAASIAQVHAAVLRSGERVVVKVQRPGIERLVQQDLAAMSWIAPLLVGRIPVAALANPPALVELFAETIVEELDFRLEAQNMLDVAAALAQLGQTAFVVPRPHPELVTRRVLVMERLSGFKFNDVAGMRSAHVDTHEVIRSAIIGFMEGALLHGVFHGDLHGGNLLVLPDGRTALLDFGITGRLDQVKRAAFLRLWIGAMVNDVTTQVAALRDLGALPPDTDVDAVIRDLRLDQPVVDPTSLTGDELVHEIQRTVKALLGYGARLPKELMLYVKNLVFIDVAIATLAPDLDLIAEAAKSAAEFTQRHGEQVARDIGIDPRAMRIDLEGWKASMGLESHVDTITYRELQERRELIRKRLQDRADRAARKRGRGLGRGTRRVRPEEREPDAAAPDPDLRR